MRLVFGRRERFRSSSVSRRDASSLFVTCYISVHYPMYVSLPISLSLSIYIYICADATSVLMTSESRVDQRPEDGSCVVAHRPRHYVIEMFRGPL